MKAIIDRFEGDFAVLTPAGGGKPINLPKSALPAEVTDGATVELVKGSWLALKDETEERRKRITDKGRRIFKE
jgi:hypothetical protein